MILNGEEVRIPELDFNVLCRLEDMGVSLSDMADGKNFTLLRAFAALIYGSPEEAGRQLTQHIVGGGDLSGLVEEITKAIEESAFFQMLSLGTKATK